MKNLIIIIGIALASMHTVHSCLCAMPKSGEEICASDGKTYLSTCAFDCSIFDQCNYNCASNVPATIHECVAKCDQEKRLTLKKVSNGKCAGSK